METQRLRRLALAFVAMLAFAVVAAGSAGAMTEVAYNNLNTVPATVNGKPNEDTYSQDYEGFMGGGMFGGQIETAITNNRVVKSLTTQLDVFACEHGEYQLENCYTVHPNKKFTQEWTASIYEVGAGNEPGALVATAQSHGQAPLPPDDERQLPGHRRRQGLRRQLRRRRLPADDRPSRNSPRRKPLPIKAIVLLTNGCEACSGKIVNVGVQTAYKEFAGGEFIAEPPADGGVPAVGADPLPKASTTTANSKPPAGRNSSPSSSSKFASGHRQRSGGPPGAGPPFGVASQTARTSTRVAAAGCASRLRAHPRSSPDRTRLQPVRLRAFSIENRDSWPSSLATDLMAGSSSAIPRTTKFGILRVGTLRARSPSLRAGSPPRRRTRGSHPPRSGAVRRPRRGHREDMERGDVAHVDEREAHARQAGHATLEQTSDRLEGVGAVGSEQRADDRARLDRHEPLGGSPLAHELPRGALGERLGFGIRRHLRVARDRSSPPRPSRGVLRARRRRLRTAATDDVITIRSAPASRLSRSTRSAPSRAGTISSSGSLGCASGNGEATCSTYRHPQRPAPTPRRGGGRPARPQPPPGIELRGDVRPHLVLARQVAHRRPDPVALPERFHDGPAAEKARPARDEHRLPTVHQRLLRPLPRPLLRPSGHHATGAGSQAASAARRAWRSEASVCGPRRVRRMCPPESSTNVVGRSVRS